MHILYKSDHPNSEIQKIHAESLVTDLRAALCNRAMKLSGRESFSHYESIVKDGVVSKIESLFELDDAFLSLRDEGIIASLFIDLLPEEQRESSLCSIELGMPRIIVSEEIYEELLRFDRFSAKTNPFDPACKAPTAIKMKLAPPHRDLAKPHFSPQFNFWCPLHKLETSESLALFPQSFEKDVFPYKRRDLDPNANSVQLNEMIGGKQFADLEKELSLGGLLQPNCEFGDILHFNSEHFHGSPRLNTRVRFSVDVRYNLNCPDDNRHYKKDSFFHPSNFINHIAVEKDTNMEYRIPYQFLLKEKLSYSDVSFCAQKGLTDLILQLHEKLETSDRHTLLKQFLPRLMSVEKRYYFLFQAAQMYKRNGMINACKGLAKMAIAQALAFDDSFDLNPIDYSLVGYHPFLQTRPKDIIRGAQEILTI